MNIVSQLSKYKSSIIIAILILFLIRLTLPQYIKFLLFPSVVLAFAMLAVSKRNLSRIFKRRIFITFLPVALVFFFFFSGLLNSEILNINLIKVTVNVLIVLLFILTLMMLEFNNKDFSYIIFNFQKKTIVICTIISLIGITKFILQLSGYRFGFLYASGYPYPKGTSLAIDHNFYSLVFVIGIIFLFPVLFKKLDWKKNLIIQLVLLLFILNALFATSRRGMIITIALIIIFLIIVDTLNLSHS